MLPKEDVSRMPFVHDKQFNHRLENGFNIRFQEIQKPHKLTMRASLEISVLFYPSMTWLPLVIFEEFSFDAFTMRDEAEKSYAKHHVEDVVKNRFLHLLKEGKLGEDLLEETGGDYIRVKGEQIISVALFPITIMVEAP